MAWLLRKPPLPCHRGGGNHLAGGGGVGVPAHIYVYIHHYILAIFPYPQNIPSVLVLPCPRWQPSDELHHLQQTLPLGLFALQVGPWGEIAGESYVVLWCRNVGDAFRAMMIYDVKLDDEDEDEDEDDDDDDDDDDDEDDYNKGDDFE